MLRGLPFSNVLGMWSGHSCSSSPALVLPEVSTPGYPPAPWVPPHSPASLYDVCVLMSGVRDARGAMLMQVGTRRP